MQKIASVLAIALIAIFFTNCASIVSKSNWPLAINTEPSGAKVEVIDKNGVVVYQGNTPARIYLKSGAVFFSKQSYTIRLAMEGYTERTVTVNCTVNGWYIGNILFGGLIGFLIVDPATGAMYKLDRTEVYETLSKETSSTTPSLKIMNINDLPKEMRKDLVCLK